VNSLAQLEEGEEALNVEKVIKQFHETFVALEKERLLTCKLFKVFCLVCSFVTLIEHIRKFKCFKKHIIFSVLFI
jgi:hypothetical protein